MKPIYNVAVCGTRFGEHYLAALTSAASSNFRLAAIVAQGSERSRQLAAQLNVPLYTDVNRLPDSIDIACVVIRSRIVGGDGSTLAEQLLQRGIAVLQEHPVHPTDIRRLQRLAKQHNTRYHVNTLYANLPSGRTFIDYVQQSASRRPPAFIEITTSLQLLYSALDIAGRALGVLSPFACTPPLAIDTLPASSQPWPFRSIQGLIAGIPFSLNLQTTLDPRDPDHHSLVMHRIAIGGPEGNVSLSSSFGPVVWSHAIYAPEYQRNNSQSSWLLSPDHHRKSRYNQQPLALTFGPGNAPNLVETTRQHFPNAILNELHTLVAAEPSRWQQQNYWVEHGEAWLGIMRAIGSPQLCHFEAPQAPYPEPISFAQQLSTYESEYNEQ